MSYVVEHDGDREGVGGTQHLVEVVRPEVVPDETKQPDPHICLRVRTQDTAHRTQLSFHHRLQEWESAKVP